MKKPVLYIVLVAAVLFMVVASQLESEPKAPEVDVAYSQEVLALRAKKEQWLRTANDSPLPQAEQLGFTGLHFYAVDPQYRYEASFTAAPSLIDEGLGDVQLVHAGWLAASIAGQDYRLKAYYEDSARSYLFVPFRDRTSGNETYGGGRYLRAPLPDADGKTVLDFNQAYNPYCVYNESFVCPLPPKENRINSSLEAGEKMWP